VTKVRITPLLLAILLSGCTEAEPQVTLGREFPMERIPAIKRGVSTKKDVEDLLGPPYRKETFPGDKIKWRYYMRKEQIKRVLFIINVGSHITENRLDIFFQGPVVHSIDKESKNFNE
jgi:outer membrane protein assembly factor BamE (lipoprotein component of BamABCDE complex)